MLVVVNSSLQTEIGFFVFSEFSISIECHVSVCFKSGHIVTRLALGFSLHLSNPIKLTKIAFVQT